MKTYYTGEGSVRGECGHRHETREAAEACCDRDGRGCRAVGGYSDRAVRTYPGDDWDDPICRACGRVCVYDDNYDEWVCEGAGFTEGHGPAD